MKPLKTHRLRYLLSYNRANGELRWKNPTSPRVSVGSIAGNVSANGYRSIQIAGRKFGAHRLAVQICTGRWPKNNIRHRDGNKSNNRWRNLRVD
jgi:hypothetical protein